MSDKLDRIRRIIGPWYGAARDFEPNQDGEDLLRENARLRGQITDCEAILRRLVDLMEADQPTQAEWDDTIADAKAVIGGLRS